MFLVAQEVELPELQKLQDRLAIVEKRIGKSVGDYVGFGKILPGNLEVFKSEGCLRIGELNEMSVYLRGRGIRIFPCGDITI